MKQKEVKIIGLKVNSKFGILQSCQIKFDEENRLIPVLGEVGSGKTTLQKSLKLGTVGSDALKDDKNLYGPVDQEVQLLDGETPIFVGCKSDKEGKINYTIYTKDDEGKIVKDPIVDGVKLTPSKYLQSLQTALTWRMDELTSENPTVQKKILLDLYKNDLEKAGVVYDKKAENYVGSILDRIEKAEAVRSEKDYLRKTNGGFAKHLIERGYNVEKPETLPEKIDIDSLKSSKNKIQYDLDNSVNNFESKKVSTLQGIEIKSEEIILSLKQKNVEIQQENKRRKDIFDLKIRNYSEAIEEINDVCLRITKLATSGVISEEMRVAINKDLRTHNDLIEPKEEDYLDIIEFDEKGICKTEFSSDPEINNLLFSLNLYRSNYIKESKKTFEGDNSEKESLISNLDQQILEAEENNKICAAINSFNEWSESNKKVIELKKEYAAKLKEIETGVEGLSIELEEIGEKMNVHLMYNGAYSPDYFSNPEKESRKLSSYSGTQKPMICLLIQNYMLSQKPKALRYLWIDNVPIDHKTKDLLHSMGDKLNVTIFINITGDFEKGQLESGEILLDGGEVFFK